MYKILSTVQALWYLFIYFIFILIYWICSLKLLESLSHSVKRGGCIAWVCGRSGGAAGHAGAFTAASEACDAVMRASLQYITKM